MRAATLDGDRLTRNALKLALRRTARQDLRVLMGWRSPKMIRRYVKAAEVEQATAAHKRFSPANHLECGVGDH